MKRFQIALVGCGARGSGYPMHLRRLGYDFDLAAVMDARFDQAELAAKTYGHSGTRRFSAIEPLLDAMTGKLDGVIVATPNAFHAAHACAVLRRRIPLLLEKPVATTLEDLENLWQAGTLAGQASVVGFVLRYTAFYQKVRDLVRSGVLGRVLSVHLEELMSDRLSSLFARGSWRPDPKLSGGLILEKCCHDMDILAWLFDSPVKQVHSFSRRTFLHPQPDAAETCDVCTLEKDCRFSYERIMRSFRGNHLDEHFDKLASQNADQSCVWSAAPQYPDHQILNLVLASGILATFSVAQAQPRNERTISILGTDARLYGEFERGTLTIIHRTGPNDERREEIQISHDGSGHGGGDTYLVRDFVALMSGDAAAVRASLGDAIRAAEICLAADCSSESGKTVTLRDWD